MRRREWRSLDLGQNNKLWWITNTIQNVEQHHNFYDSNFQHIVDMTTTTQQNACDGIDVKVSIIFWMSLIQQGQRSTIASPVVMRTPIRYIDGYVKGASSLNFKLSLKTKR